MVHGYLGFYEGVIGIVEDSWMNSEEFFGGEDSYERSSESAEE